MHCRARGKHAAPGHRVDMSSRLPPYFTQIKSNIPPPTAYAVGHGRHLCCTPHSDIILGRFLVQRLYALFVVLFIVLTGCCLREMTGDTGKQHRRLFHIRNPLVSLWLPLEKTFNFPRGQGHA